MVEAVTDHVELSVLAELTIDGSVAGSLTAVLPNWNPARARTVSGALRSARLLSEALTVTATAGWPGVKDPNGS
jgi:hypothetical protein